MRNWIAKLLALLLLLGAPASLRAAGDPAAAIKDKLLVMPTGGVVEVQTRARQKLRGRLGAIAAESFEMQTAQGEKVQTQSLRFDQVKSVKAVRVKKGMSAAAKIGWIALAGTCCWA
ncbi:MAG TPA: hypothetical protein VGF49_19155 [Candidatus Solibacter sp.]